MHLPMILLHELSETAHSHPLNRKRFCDAIHLGLKRSRHRQKLKLWQQQQQWMMAGRQPHPLPLPDALNPQENSSLHRSETWVRAIFDHAPIAISLVNLADCRIVQINAAHCQMFGYSATELADKTFIDLTHPDDIDMNLERFEQMKRGEIPGYQLEKRFIKKNGDIIWTILTVALIRDRHEQPIYSMGMMQDITERKQAETALQQSEQKFRQLAENIQSVFWITDAGKQKMVYISPAYEQVWGRSCESLYAAPKSFVEAIHPQDRPRILAKFAQQDWKHYDVEYRIIQPDGTVRWIHDRAFLICNTAGEAIRIAGIAQDITVQKQIEETLNRQLATIEAAIDAIAILNSNGNHTYVNAAHVRLFGYDHSEELIGKPWQEFYSSAEISRFEWDIFPVLMKQRAWRGEATATRRDGSTFAEELSLTLTASGEVICVRRDISDRKQAQLLLQSQKEFLRRLIDTVPNLIFVKDSQGRFTLVNQATATIYGTTIEALVGKTEADFNARLAEIDPDPCVDRARMTLNTKVVLEGTVTLANGEQRHFQTIKTPIVSADGQSQSLLGVVTDISSYKQIEDQLRQTNEQLATANLELARATRLKDEFLANMSHELRTPLNAILGMSEGLQEEVYGLLTERQRKALVTIEQSGKHLLELINDILDLAKIGSGKMDLEIAPVTLEQLCDSSLTFIKQQAVQKNIHLIAHIPDRQEEIQVDERRIRQILINLLSNATKFTPSGGTVSLEVELNIADMAVYFRVSDTGIGIGPEHLEKLFQTFVQIDSSLSRTYSGTGLGLALVRQITEMHQGSVYVTSQIGKGSCFTVKLPWRVQPATRAVSADLHPVLPPLQATLLQSDLPQSDVEGEALPTTRTAAPVPLVRRSPSPSPLILLAEDNQANIDTLSTYLTCQGYQLAVAQTGLEAITLAKALQPQLILMDIQMPQLDGFTAIGRIRSDSSLANTPIIALTALAMPGDRERCLEAGANEYLTKPTNLKRLTSLVKALIGEGID